MDIPEAVRAAVQANKPAIAIAVRIKRGSGPPVEAPVFVSCELGGTKFDDIAIMLAGLKTLYLQLVQQLAESGGILEQEFHNKIAEHMDHGWTDGGWVETN